MSGLEQRKLSVFDPSWTPMKYEVDVRYGLSRLPSTAISSFLREVTWSINRIVHDAVITNYNLFVRCTRTLPNGQRQLLFLFTY